MNKHAVIPVLFLLIGVSGCTPAADPSLPIAVVHKSATCNCCMLWVAHLQASGFKVDVTDESTLVQIKKRVGVPLNTRSCHTAEIGGYFVEGHVPAEDIKHLLATKPQAKGLVVPEMPLGSPGMEKGTKKEPYDVLLVDIAGNTSVFAHHGD